MEQKRFCTSCGTPIEKNTKFCVTCGQKQGGKVTTSKVDEGRMQTPSVEMIQPVKKKRSLIIVGIIIFVLVGIVFWGVYWKNSETVSAQAEEEKNFKMKDFNMYMYTDVIPSMFADGIIHQKSIDFIEEHSSWFPLTEESVMAAGSTGGTAAYYESMEDFDIDTIRRSIMTEKNAGKLLQGEFVVMSINEMGGVNSPTGYSSNLLLMADGTVDTVVNVMYDNSLDDVSEGDIVYMSGVLVGEYIDEYATFPIPIMVGSYIEKVDSDEVMYQSVDKNPPVEEGGFSIADTIIQPENTEYILPYSNTQLLTNEDLSGLNQDELRIAKNEIYARHGRIFSSQDLQNYFDSKSWYSGTISADAFNENVLSQVEKDNVALIVSKQDGGQDSNNNNVLIDQLLYTYYEEVDEASDYFILMPNIDSYSLYFTYYMEFDPYLSYNFIDSEVVGNYFYMHFIDVDHSHELQLRWEIGTYFNQYAEVRVVRDGIEFEPTGYFRTDAVVAN
ncbi:MAG: YARHG domain-containing protein [Lachnospiraceae bacterium]